MIDIIPQPTPINHSKGRGGQRVLAIVDHIMEGSVAGTGSWFRDPRARVSAHYGVALSGAVVQYVADEDTAWHAGKVVRPTSALLAEVSGNPNRWSIGIEHEGHADTVAPATQIQASAELHALLAARHSIPLDRRHVILHREIRADKTCPGLLPVDEIIALARRPVEGPRPGDRRWSPYLGEWVILTRYVDDDEWYYVRESELREAGARAGARWSEMARGAV